MREPKPTLSRPVRAVLAAFSLLVGMALLGACAPTEEEIRVEREELRATLEEYLPRMAEVYRTGDLEPLRPYASERELAVLQKNISDQAARGQSFDNELVELTIESVSPMSEMNVMVRTVETWSVKLRPVGSEEGILGQTEAQVSRVQYHLQRTDNRWRVMARDRAVGESEETGS